MLTQVKQISSHLKIYGRITSWEAIQQYRCTRLAEYIRQLREEGQDIESKWMEHNGKRFVEYVLVKNGQPELALVNSNGESVI